MTFQKGQSGNPKGRPKGARQKLTEAFIKVLSADFQRHGKKTLETVRKDDPAAYCKLVAQLVPKEVEATLDGELIVKWQQ